MRHHYVSCRTASLSTIPDDQQRHFNRSERIWPWWKIPNRIFSCLQFFVLWVLYAPTVWGSKKNRLRWIHRAESLLQIQLFLSQLVISFLRYLNWNTIWTSRFLRIAKIIQPNFSESRVMIFKSFDEMMEAVMKYLAYIAEIYSVVKKFSLVRKQLNEILQNELFSLDLTTVCGKNWRSSLSTMKCRVMKSRWISI